MNKLECTACGHIYTVRDDHMESWVKWPYGGRKCLAIACNGTLIRVGPAVAKEEVKEKSNEWKPDEARHDVMDITRRMF